MTANKLRIPSYIGGRLKGVTIDMIGASEQDVFFMQNNGLFYLYQGRRFPILTGSGEKIGNNVIYTWSKIFPLEFVPSADIVLEFDSTGLQETKISIKIMWEV